MAERYRIRRLSADDIQDAEAKRRAAINAERIKLGYSRKEAASALPGAAFLAQGKRARSQQTGERAEFFKAQQTEKSMLVANDAAATRHGWSAAPWPAAVAGLGRALPKSIWKASLA